MSVDLGLPLYVIRHGGGFVSIVADTAAETPPEMLAVYSLQEDAVRFMTQMEVSGSIGHVSNNRELAWLLKSLKPPVEGIIVDPSADAEANEHKRQYSIEQLLDELQVDMSPWNYPIFAIALDSGFSSIQGTASDGRPLTAIELFTSRQAATDHLESLDEKGTLCAMQNVEEARRFLGGLELNVFSVAVDPSFESGQVSARHCFDIATLLEKYLVEKPAREA